MRTTLSTIRSLRRRAVAFLDAYTAPRWWLVFVLFGVQAAAVSCGMLAFGRFIGAVPGLDPLQYLAFTLGAGAMVVSSVCAQVRSVQACGAWPSGHARPSWAGPAVNSG